MGKNIVEIFKQEIQQKGLTYTQVASRIDGKTTKQDIYYFFKSRSKNDDWSVGDIKTFCAALGLDFNAVVRATILD